MKRFLNVGQPPAPSGFLCLRHLGDRPDSRAQRSRRQRLCFVPRRDGDGAGQRVKRLSQLHQGSVRRRSESLLRGVRRGHIPAQQRSYHHRRACAGISSAASTERHNRLEYFNPTARASSSGVSYTGAEDLRQQRQPLALHHEPEEFRSAPGLLVAAGAPPRRSRRRRHLLWPQRADGRRRRARQRRLLLVRPPGTRPASTRTATPSSTAIRAMRAAARQLRATSPCS